MLIARNEHDRKNFVEDLKEAILEVSQFDCRRSKLFQRTYKHTLV
jgi:PH domain